jgi:hypothetical protein
LNDLYIESHNSNLTYFSATTLVSRCQREDVRLRDGRRRVRRRRRQPLLLARGPRQLRQQLHQTMAGQFKHHQKGPHVTLDILTDNIGMKRYCNNSTILSH